MKKKRKLHYINPKGKFILSPQEQRRGPWFKGSIEGHLAAVIWNFIL